MSKYIVINSVAATAGDLTTPGQGIVKVTGDPIGFKRGDVEEIAILPFLNEELQVTRVTATASPAASTTYQFVLTQEVNGVMKQNIVSYATGSGAAPSAAVFAAALTASVQGLIDSDQFQISVAAYTSGNGGVDITALTGYATFTIKQTSNLTVDSQLASGTSSGNLSASGTTLTMLNSSTANFVVGDLVKLTGWTGTAVIDGKTAAQGVILRVSAISTNTSVTFVATTVTGSISAAAVDYERIASNQRGLGSGYIAKGITAGGNPSKVVIATDVYHEVVVKGGSFAGKSLAQEDLAPFTNHYLISSTTDTANALLLLARFGEVKNYYGAGVTTVDPALLG